jgi:hypothetical protein
MSPRNTPVYYDYVLKSGDTLSGIIHKMYGQAPGSSGYRKSLDFVLSLNPQIKNPNRIYPGNVIHLGVIPAAPKAVSPVVTSKPGKSIPTHLSRQDIDYLWALSWLEHNPNSLVVPGSILAGATSNLLSPGNTALINKVSDLYAEYKSGILTKGQYDARRKGVLDQLKRNLGPAERLLFGNKTTHETIRIARGGGMPATAHIDKNFARLTKAAQLGKYGGIVLTGVGVAASCAQIADTQDRNEKNEIFVETVVSTAMGGVGGYLVGVFLISNPAGWGTALVLATGATALSYLSGKGAKYVYDLKGNKYDFVKGTGVDRLCR